VKPTLFLLGHSDRDLRTPPAREWVDGMGWKLSADCAGVLPILPFVESDRTLHANSTVVMLGAHNVNLDARRGINLFNLVGDADASGIALREIDRITRAIKPRRVFNAPWLVHATARARLPQTLAHLPDCIVPRALEATPSKFEELLAVCRQFNCWPLIVRAKGHHGGEHMVLLTNESELELLRDLAWPYRGIVLMQFLDCRTEDGLYQKIRVMMVDGEPYARQCIYSDHWMIHSGSRSAIMNHDLSLCRREEQFLAELRDTFLRERAPLFRQIYQRVKLDVFGIDFALVNGRLVIFEANACMHFLGREGAGSPRYAYTGEYKKALRRAVKRMLLHG